MSYASWPPVPGREFHTTRWSVIREAAANDKDDTGLRAMADFCRNYREPLLAFARATAYHPQDAEDLVHGFFEKLLTQNLLNSADPERGRLRTFLLTCLKRHIIDERRRQCAEKRGGGVMAVPLDDVRELPSGQDSLDVMFHRQWAMVILSRALATLRQRWTDAGKERLFAALQPWLGFQAEGDGDRAALAAEFGMSKGALKTALYRLRRDYHDILMQEVADTLDVKTTEEVKSELKELLVLV